MKMKNIFLITLICLLTGAMQSQNLPVNIVSGKFSSTRDKTLLKTFGASKGDVIEINAKSLHKKKGFSMSIVQHPGDLLVLDYEGSTTLMKRIIAPADVIYQVYHGGDKVDFEINIANFTDKPNGPGRGDIVYVRIPDTLHVSGYVNKPIGENYKLVPYKEKVVLNSIIQTEPVANRDFITGVDLLNLYIPGDIKDEYREQKLLSYNVSLIVDAPSSYSAISGVVKAGMDAFIPEISPAKFIGGNKAKKMDPGNMYEVVKDVEKEKEKWEKTIQTIKLAQELGDSLRPGENTTADKILETTGFLLDTDGMKKMALNKGLKAMGASNEVLALTDKVMNIPSATDFLKSGFDKYASQIKGRANLRIIEPQKFTEPVYTSPETGKKFLIQSAMNYGKNDGGYWDVPGNKTTIDKGANIQIWSLDEGIDRQFTLIPSSETGFFEITVGNTENSRINIDGGKSGNGTNVEVWDKDGRSKQQFRFHHVGNGKFKIYDRNGKALCTEGRKNANGTNIHIWDDHDGEWTEWYLIDVTTKVAFIPQKTNRTVDVWRDVELVNKTGGAINETIEVAGENDPINPNLPYKEVKIRINERDYVSDAKLIVEAKYRITDYTEVVKYKRETKPVFTQDFWTAYKVVYDYGMMFKDQVKDYYEIISESEFNNPKRITTEVIRNNDEGQQNRLNKFQTLTVNK